MANRTPLDDLEFLARSPHRVRVLKELTNSPKTRQELHEVTDVSQPTLGRILGSCQDRGWLSKDGQEYALTPFGALLAEEFADLLDTVETMQRLQTIAPYLPLDEMDFDLRSFREATITTPHSPDVYAYVHRGERLIREAEQIRWLGNHFALESIPKQRELVLEMGQKQEVIISRAAFDDFVSHPGVREQIRELFETGSLTVYQFEGTVPVALITIDERAGIIPYNEQSVPCGLIDTTNDAIRDWVTTTIDEYRERADPVDIRDLSE